MRLLLDTHVFLWWRSGKAMRQQVMDAIRGADEVFVSAASGWEVAIKVATGRMRLSASFADGVADSEFESLPITMEHAETVAQLPAHHRDPFDRMLIAQARAERLTLVTADRELERYGGSFLWV